MKLIFGANGKLGTDFKELFDSIGEKYIATDKDEVDITNGDFLRAYIKTMHQNYKIDTIINCAAYNDVDKAETEKELCYKLNAEAPANLAMIASEIGATFITYSTDFVFNGLIEGYLYNESTGYTEEKGCESGIYHFTNDDIASKYDQAKYILEKISWKGNLIRAKSEELGLLAERPKFSKLSCKKIKEKLGVSIPNWKDAIDRYFKENNK